MLTYTEGPGNDINYGKGFITVTCLVFYVRRIVCPLCILAENCVYCETVVYVKSSEALTHSDAALI